MSRREPRGSSSRLIGRVHGGWATVRSDGHFTLDEGVVLVVFEDEVLVLVLEDGLRLARESQGRVRVGLARQLQIDLLHEVVVDVHIAASPDELTQLQIALLRDHHRQQRVAGDVERNSQKHVGTALV